jgi:hypothetical protein
MTPHLPQYHVESNSIPIIYNAKEFDSRLQLQLLIISRLF